MQPRALGGSWDLGFAVGVGMVEVEEVVAGTSLAGIAGVCKSFIFLTLSLETGMGDRFAAARPAGSQ